jgi:ethanolamine-phosphate cytidylyltransferase
MGVRSSSPVSARSVRSSSLAAGGFDSEDEGDRGGLLLPDMRRARLAERLAQLPSASHSRFLPTARRIMQFAEGRVPGPEDVVVYMAGGWDVFNPGHIAALAAARQQGSFLLVGIYDDATINKLRGHGLPILNLYERALSLLSCK